MNMINTDFTEPADGLAIIRDADQLDMFLDPKNAAAVWPRKPDEVFQKWVNNLSVDQLPNGRLILDINEVDEAVRELCNAAKTPQGPELDYLQNDISTLARLFANLTNASTIRLRVDVVTTNACRRFHIDAVTARLVCTYRGTGTQLGFAQNNNEPKTIFTAPTGSPVLLHGTLRTSSDHKRLLHRSPPIEGTGETRLVLVVDPIFDPSEAL